MRSVLFGLVSTSALVVSSLVLFANVTPAHAQPKPAASSAAKPAASNSDAKVIGKADKRACAEKPTLNLSDPKKKTEAKKAYDRGKERLEKADHEGALACFMLADGYVPGAKPKYFVAQSLDRLGKVAEAITAYKAFLKDVVPTPDTAVPDKFKDDVATAKARIEALKPAPKKVEGAVTPADGRGTEPGPSGPAAKPARADPAAEPPVTSPYRLPPPGAESPPERKMHGKTKVGLVMLGIAGAGALLGGTFGGMALASKSEFDKLAAPGGGGTTKTLIDKADETERHALVADMFFVWAAAPFGIAATVLLIVGARSEPPQSTGKTLQEKAQAALRRGFVAPYATPDGGGAAARFLF